MLLGAEVKYKGQTYQKVWSKDGFFFFKLCNHEFNFVGVSN